MAKKSDFLESLKRRRDEAGDRGDVDPASVKEEWLRELDQLMGEIEAWLQPATEEKLLTVKREMEPVEEELLGKYDAPTLKIRIASGEEVRLLPLRFVIAYLGRIRVECWERYRNLFRKPEGWVVAWSLSPPDEEPLNEDSFQRVLEDVLPDLP